jgi:hypothetical protein
MTYWAFPRQPHERIVCFDVANIDELAVNDPAVFTRFEEQIGWQGALPVRVDVPSRTICVVVMKELMTDAEVTAAVETFGFKVQLKQGEDQS